jgi:hypothetical protein
MKFPATNTIVETWLRVKSSEAPLRLDLAALSLAREIDGTLTASGFPSLCDQFNPTYNRLGRRSLLELDLNESTSPLVIICLRQWRHSKFSDEDVRQIARELIESAIFALYERGLATRDGVTNSWTLLTLPQPEKEQDHGSDTPKTNSSRRTAPVRKPRQASTTKRSPR